MISEMIIAGIGGFIGSGCRYLTGVLAKRWFGEAYPWGTFAVNMIGCFIVGLLVGIWSNHGMNQMMISLLIIGFCGGYTTFSTFSLDSYKMIADGAWVKLLLYVVPSIVLGVVFVYLGYALG